MKMDSIFFEEAIIIKVTIKTERDFAEKTKFILVKNERGIKNTFD